MTMFTLHWQFTNGNESSRDFLTLDDLNDYKTTRNMDANKSISKTWTTTDKPFAQWVDEQKHIQYLINKGEM